MFSACARGMVKAAGGDVESVTVRSMCRGDLPRVVAIEAASQPLPWSVERFARELDLPHARLTVACVDDEIVGFLCAWEIAGEFEVQNVVTAPTWRRRGVGGALLAEATEHARRSGCSRLLLEVRSGNVAAIALYRHHAYVPCGTRRGYYADGEDALLMERHLDRTDGVHPDD